MLLINNRQLQKMFVAGSWIEKRKLKPEYLLSVFVMDENIFIVLYLLS